VLGTVPGRTPMADHERGPSGHRSSVASGRPPTASVAGCSSGLKGLSQPPPVTPQRAHGIVD